MIKWIVMKLLLIVLFIRFVFFLFEKNTGKKTEPGMNEYEDDWSNPSEHNVWW